MTGRLYVYRLGLWMSCLPTFAGGVVVTARAADSPPVSGLVEQLPRDQAVAVLGKTVSTPDGNVVGRLIDVLVNAEGMPEAGVIDFGGFMGVGARKIAVHWATLHFTPANPKQSITLDLTPDQIKAVPEYRDTGNPAPVVLPATTGPRIGEPQTAQTQTGQPKTGEAQTGGPQTGGPETGEAQTSGTQTGEPRTAEPRAGEPRTGEPRTGEPRTGEPQTGERETGKPETGSSTDKSPPGSP